MQPTCLGFILISYAKDPNKLTLRDIVPTSDVSNYFNAFVGTRTHLWGSTVNVPNIRDNHGILIKPDEYETKLHDLTPVTVDVTLKL